MELLQRRENMIRQWFTMWLSKQNTGLENIFSSDAIYIESWGPEYHGMGAIKYWFEEWNTRGTVQRWDIQQFFHKEDETVVQWQFQCELSGEPDQSFEGLSLIRWDKEDKICFLQEFGCSNKRYDPYADGPVPVFEDDPAMWL